MHTPVISISMPAYNVEQYIGEAIESILAQTFTDWELIVVDDCSKDRTVAVVNEYAAKDSRIRIIKRQENSGSVRLPRFDGVKAARGQYICTIDSDDAVEPEYLQKMMVRQQATGSDIVLGRMRLCNQKLQEDGRMIPTSEYNMKRIFTGREAALATLGGWQLAMNGMLVVSDLYKDYVSRNYLGLINAVYADELDHRKLLLRASSVAMTDASYSYRQQAGSVVHQVSLRRFDELKVVEHYLDFVCQNFSDDKATINKVLLECLEKTYRCQQMFLANKKSWKKDEESYVSELIKTTHERVTSYKITGLGFKYRLLSASYPLFVAVTHIINTVLPLKIWNVRKFL